MRALIIALCVATTFCKQNHELWLGETSKITNDDILYETEGYKYGFPLIVRSVIIDFPPPGASNNAVISSIYVDGKGYPTYVRILEGGLGHRNVKMELSSGRGSGLNYKVKIFGYENILS